MDELHEALLRSMSEPAKKPEPVDLGWMNSWQTIPPLYEKCMALHHRRSDEEKSGHGYEHIVRCLEGCNFVLRYDSSD